MSAHMWLGDAWGLIGMLAALAFVALVVLAIAAVARPGSRADSQPPSSSALRVLEERYARGEISREEFLERRQVLTSRAPEDGP